jgi:hypothetical protein
VDGGVVAGGAHDVEDVGLLEPGPAPLAEAVGDIGGHPTERVLLRDHAADPRLAHVGLGLKIHLFGGAGPAASVAVVGPWSGQV